VENQARQVEPEGDDEDHSDPLTASPLAPVEPATEPDTGLFRVMAAEWPGAVLLLDRELCVQWANPRASRLLQLSYPIERGRRWQHLGVPWTLEREQIAALLDGRELSLAPARLFTGGVFNWTATLTPMRGGSLVTTILCRIEPPSLQASPSSGLAGALRAEIELHSTEVRLETAMWGAELGLWEFDCQAGSMRWFTPQWLNQYELDPLVYGGDTRRESSWVASIHPEDVAEAQRRFREHIAGTQDHYDAEYRLKAREGGWRWVFERGRIVERAKSGRALRMIGVLVDIDARKKVQLEQRATRHRLEVALDSARGAMWELDLSSDWDPVHTEFFYRMLGVDPAMGRNHPTFWSSHVHPGDLVRVRAALERTARGEIELYEAEYRVRDFDGSWRWVQDRGRVCERSPEGHPRRLAGFLSEITDRVGAEDALRRSEFRYRMVASMTPGYVFESRFGPNGVVEPVWYSDGLQVVFACSQEEYFRRGGWNAFVDPECEVTSELHQRRVRQGLPQSGEVRIRAADGARKWVYASTVPIKDPQSGAATGFIGAVHDITGRKLAEQERQALEREIIGISSRERERLGSDLHDGLGQDLTGIALLLRGVHAQLSKEGSGARAEVEEVIGLVNGAIESTRALARGLSPVSRVRGGLTAGLESLARTGERHGIRVGFRTQLPKPLRLEDTAATHLYRIAQEALTNVLRHSKATEARIELATAGDLLLLEITDNGCGFTSAALERSDGLGLKMMRYRAQTLGGDVTVASGPDGGAHVRCTCPLTRHGLAVRELAAPARPARPRRPRKATRKAQVRP
jgi:PAS domain S-box-containing protein